MGSRVIHIQITLLLCYFLPCLAEDFIFNGFQQAAESLTLGGVAKIIQGDKLELTDNSNFVMGQAFFSSPIPMIRNQQGNSTVASFSTSFVFQIITEEGSNGGQGLTFAITPSGKLPDAYFGQYLGLLGPTNNGNFSNHVFAVEFDTAMAKDKFIETNGNHVGIDINDLNSIVSTTAGYYANESNKTDLLLENGQPIQAWIDYNGTIKVISVTIAPLSVSKPFKPLISLAMDLMPIFEEEMHVGFTSSTSKHRASSHYILAWSFRTGGAAQSIDLSSLPKLPNSSSRQSGHITTKIKVLIISTIAAFAFIVILVGVLLYAWKRTRLPEEIEDWELNHPHRIEYKDIYKATKGFNKTELLGSGGFGHVYKGIMPRTEEVVAIKRTSNNTRQGMREFASEILNLGRMRHRNLVELRGWCKQNEDLIIVYEFMPNGSLDTLLFNHKNSNRAITSWHQRLTILKGVASGLLYLHEEWKKVVVHRDINSSNVLLGTDLIPKLGDFGLARPYDHGENPQTTSAAGTRGYMAPELLHMGKATTSSDVFAFGVLLLEVACGRRPIEPSAPENEVSLVKWVKDCFLSSELTKVVDPRLGDEYDYQEVEMVLKLGLVCCQSRPEVRPSIREVIQYLNGSQQLVDDLPLLFQDVKHDFLEPQPAKSVHSSHGSVSMTSLRVGR
ncbi:hypothetical protein LUZ63_008837 [Rhynchospora breviuscula]|uniref:non-specific serine/threonine protein kinase n=1 Tax=Rhynchospora breviuscula TaxID=2022672 RepID=A0A9Q0CDW6_9POAL|nr:hypothetical protein LUZ63_008837 [Rhynchospora breviuscula]